jgi:ABC-type glycerol-3-phosphate transport system permease component
MVQVPEAMLEAARIDGAGELRVWWRVVMPTVKPAWLTLTIFAFREIWNSYNSTTYIYDRSKMMLSTMLNSIVNSGIGYTGIGAVVILVLLLPPFVLFLFAQKAVIETMMTSGIK